MAHLARLSLDLCTESCKIPRSHLTSTEMKVPPGKGSFSHGLGTFCKVPLRSLKNSVNLLKMQPKFRVYVHFF